MSTNLCLLEIACRLNTVQIVPWHLQNEEQYSDCCAYIQLEVYTKVNMYENFLSLIYHWTW